jgi:hypothetical protein
VCTLVVIKKSGQVSTCRIGPFPCQCNGMNVIPTSAVGNKELWDNSVALSGNPHKYRHPGTIYTTFWNIYFVVYLCFQWPRIYNAEFLYSEQRIEQNMKKGSHGLNKLVLQFLERSEEIHEKTQSAWPVSKLIFEPVSSRIQVTSFSTRISVVDTTWLYWLAVIIPVFNINTNACNRIQDLLNTMLVS